MADTIEPGGAEEKPLWQIRSGREIREMRTETWEERSIGERKN
jgi:hypothetical protein